MPCQLRRWGEVARLNSLAQLHPGGPVDTPPAVRPSVGGRRREFLRLACGSAVLCPRSRQQCRYLTAQKNAADTRSMSAAPGRLQRTGNCFQLSQTPVRIFRILRRVRIIHACRTLASIRPPIFRTNAPAHQQSGKTPPAIQYAVPECRSQNQAAPAPAGNARSRHTHADPDTPPAEQRSCNHTAGQATPESQAEPRRAHRSSDPSIPHFVANSLCR